MTVSQSAFFPSKILFAKSLGMAPGLANARPSGSTKFANAPPQELTRRANARPGWGGGGGGARLELTDKVSFNLKMILIVALDVESKYSDRALLKCD